MKPSCSLHLSSFKMCEQAYNHDLLHKMQLQFILSSGTFKRSGFLSISLTIGYSDCAINAETSVLCKLRAKTHTCTARCFYCHSVSVHVPRLGGGFGGKQVTSIFPASAAALAATCTGRSVPHSTCSPVSLGGGVGGGKQVTSIFPALAATYTGRSVPHPTCSSVSVGGGRGLSR